MPNKNHSHSLGTLPTPPRPAPANEQLSLLLAGPPVRRSAMAPVAGLLLFSGMCGLVYQVCWFREFRLLFGASTAASSAVLAVFMAGLGIGNAVLGKRADRAKFPLAWYALLEFSIAATAAVSPWLIGGLHGLYIALGGQLALGFTVATVVRLAISAVVLGVPTFLMGGTLPAAVRAVTRSDDYPRRGAAWLYAANALGAVAGALLSTFVALELFGMRATLWLASLINLCTALAALALGRYTAQHGSRTSTTAPLAGPHWRKGRQSLREGARREPNPTTPARAAPASAPYLIYAIAGIGGFAFFLMEIVWHRMLGPILGGTTFTFGLVLAVALLGIGLGGAAYALVFRRRPASLRALAIVCLLESCCVAAPFALGDRIAILAVTLRAASATTFLADVMGWATVAAIVVLPAALVSGFQVPLLVGLLGQGDKDVGKQLGLAYGWNTVGAICGALAGGFGLLPLLSAPGAWRVVVVVTAIMGVAVFACARPPERRRTWLIAVAALVASAIGMIALPGPTAVWRHGAVGAGRIARARIIASSNNLHNWENEIRRSVVWEADGVESSVAIVAADGLAFYVNGMCDGNAVQDVGTQVMLGMIPAALHPRPQNACVVGLGTGETAGWLADVPSVEHVDVVELEPAVQEMARRCRAVNRDVMANPKVRLIFNDAREVLLTTASRYDLIVCEPSNPYRSGIANLFTREFYSAGRDRLNDGGLFVQWVQAYEIDQRTMRTVLATFRSIFPHVEIWQSKPGDLVLVGSADPRAYSAAELRSRAAAEPFASALRCACHTTELEGLLSHYVGGAALVDHFIGNGPAAINSDDHNAVEYGFARTVGRTDWDAEATLRRQSVEIGDQRLKVGGGAVDWRAATLARQWDAAVRSGRTLSANDLKLADGTSDEVLARYAAKDARGMMLAWESLPHSAPCLTELAVVALLYAESGSSLANPLIKQLGTCLPNEAEALRGILAWRRGKLSEAGRHLGDALLRLRGDPWMLDFLRAKTHEAAIAVAKADPSQASGLLRAFGEPFAANSADEGRRAIACVIAGGVGPAEASHIIESFEPHVPWTEEFLAYRQRMYRAAGHRLAAQAERDLREYARCAGAGR
jgi:spermidine synthase